MDNQNNVLSIYLLGNDIFKIFYSLSVVHNLEGKFLVVS